MGPAFLYPSFLRDGDSSLAARPLTGHGASARGDDVREKSGNGASPGAHGAAGYFAFILLEHSSEPYEQNSGLGVNAHHRPCECRQIL